MEIEYNLIDYSHYALEEHHASQSSTERPEGVAVAPPPRGICDVATFEWLNTAFQSNLRDGI